MSIHHQHASDDSSSYRFVLEPSGSARPLRPRSAEDPREISTISYQGAPPTSPLTKDEPPIVDRHFGEYHIQSEIGRGGVGVVYKAFHRGLNRFVALKRLRVGALASDDEIRQFQNEAQFAARLNHPHIVPVHEVGVQDGVHYYTMSLVEGETLRAKLRHGRWASSAAAELVETLAQAVHYAHQHDVIHRDLKPGNILIDAAGQPHITDFGIAKLLHEDSFRTMIGEVLGTPNYLAPEQAGGLFCDTTIQSDVYSLGATLFCLLTGRPPFAAATIPETLHRVLHCEPPSPRRLNPGIPQDLETICLKCLQKNPAQRYESAQHLAEDLRCFQQQCHWARCTGHVWAR